MTSFPNRPRTKGSAFDAFARDEQAASAIEFAILSGPFLMLLLGILQMGVYYLAQTALDAGVIRTADTLRVSFTTGTSPTLPSGSSLKSQVATNSGGMINNSASLSVEIRQLVSLNSAVVPIVDGTTDYGSTTSTLVLRAQSRVVNFVPGFSSLTKVTSSAMVRRQGT